MSEQVLHVHVVYCHTLTLSLGTSCASSVISCRHLGLHIVTVMLRGPRFCYAIAEQTGNVRNARETIMPIAMYQFPSLL